MHKFNLLKPKWIELQILLVLICHIQVLFSQITSPISQGKWIKIAVTQSQFYHINNAWLSKIKSMLPALKTYEFMGPNQVF